MKFLIAFVILVIVLIVLAFSGMKVREVFSFFIDLYGERLSKIKLARWYDVSKTTLNNWVETYCEEIPKAWNGCKKITAEMLIVIFKNLGLPFLQKTFSRKELSNKLGIEYPTLRYHLDVKYEAVGFTSESQYENVRIFPPLISRNIIKVLSITQ